MLAGLALGGGFRLPRMLRRALSRAAGLAKLQLLASGGLQANPRLTPLLREDPMLAGAVEQTVPQISNWTLTKNGLTITFPRGLVAANSAGFKFPE